jgi:hypothetical protein
MKFFSILFIISTLYYLLNRNRLLLKTVSRIYKSKSSIFFDIIYYFTDILYLIWIVIMMFYEIKMSLLLILLVIFRWLFLNPFKNKQDMTYIILKLMILFAVIIS